MTKAATTSTTTTKAAKAAPSRVELRARCVQTQAAARELARAAQLAVECIDAGASDETLRDCVGQIDDRRGAISGE
jgi:hypothetical protein